jgi:hypothetical protein
MPQILFTGWSEGLQKIALDKLLRDRVPMRLAEAKRVVDRLLEGEEVLVAVDSEAAAREIIMGARNAGAICRLHEPVANATSTR